VLGAITRAILETPMHSADAQEQCERPAPRQFVVTEWVDAAEQFRQAVSTAIYSVVAIALMVTPPVTAAVVVWSSFSLSLSKAAEARVIEATGISTLAAVTHWRNLDACGLSGCYYSDSYEITYKSLDGQARGSTIKHSPLLGTFLGTSEEATYQANVDALLVHVMSHCSDVDPSPVGKEGKIFRGYRCENVRLRYAQDAPEYFVLLDFPPNRTWWDSLRDSAWQMAVTFFGLTWTGLLIVVFSGRLISMILGVRFPFAD
jgi:hypothetical protein